MGIIPSEVEEHAIREERLPGAPLTPGAREYRDRFANIATRAGIALAVIALGVAFALGFLLLRSVRRLNGRMARLSQQIGAAQPPSRGRGAAITAARSAGFTGCGQRQSGRAAAR